RANRGRPGQGRRGRRGGPAGRPEGDRAPPRGDGRGARARVAWVRPRGDLPRPTRGRPDHRRLDRAGRGRADGARPMTRRDARSRRPILVAGAPRTGTTWVARALGSSPDATLINEPDNEWPNPFALRAKLPLGQYPVLGPGDEAPKAYDLLWRKAFEGFRQ